MRRQIPTRDNLFQQTLQQMQDQIDNLVRGAQNAGRVSFSNQIQVGDVLITTSGDTVTFLNVTDGKKATITLV